MGRRLVLVAAVLVVLGVASRAEAQTGTICETNCVVRQAEPFYVITDPIPAATGYHLYLNGAQVTVSWTIDPDGFVSFAYPTGLMAGSYQFVITADTPTGPESTDPNTLSVIKRKIRFKTGVVVR